MTVISWQRLMIRMARSARAKSWAERKLSTSALPYTFVGGRTLPEAMQACRRLREASIRSSLYYLGEYLTDPAAIEDNVRHARDAVAALAEEPMDIHLSVDPTQLGHAVSKDLMLRNALSLGLALREASAARGGAVTDMLMLDMEDPRVVVDTIDLRRSLAGHGVPVGITIQASLRRSIKDVEELIGRGSGIRLVKGAFATPSSLAFRAHGAIRAAFLALAERLLSRDARSAGCYPSFATHDQLLIDRVRQLAASNRWRAEEYEFEMLFGVREGLQRQLAGAGHRVRAYVPFGEDWWPYAARRVGEHAPNLFLALRQAKRASG